MSALEDSESYTDSVNIFTNNNSSQVLSMPEMVDEKDSAPTEVKNAMWDAEPEKKKKGSSENLNVSMKEETIKKYQLEDKVINIPTLEAKNEEELIKKIAEAPQQNVRQVQSFKELERRVFDASSLNKNEDGFDLTLLTGFLIPPEQCFEVSEEWNEKTFLDLIPRTRKVEEKKKSKSSLNLKKIPSSLLSDPIPKLSSSKSKSKIDSSNSNESSGQQVRGRRRGRERKRVKI